MTKSDFSTGVYANPLSQQGFREGLQKPVVYSIAGSDSSAGAGVEADLGTLHDLGVHGCAVITALTAQDSRQITRVLPTPVVHLSETLRLLSADMPAAAIKLGLLANAKIIQCVHRYLKNYSGFVVCDPVISASVGQQLCASDVRQAFLKLLPDIDLLTPNIDEVAFFTGLDIQTYAHMEQAAQQLLGYGAKAVLIKGGHLAEKNKSRYTCNVSEESCDYFTDGTRAFWLANPRIDTIHNHGTGCTLSSAIAGAVAKGYALSDALVLAKMTLNQGLREAVALGRGRGPVAHVGWPERCENLPVIYHQRPDCREHFEFPDCGAQPLGLYPVVDSLAQLQLLMEKGVTTLQLRLKNLSSAEVEKQIVEAVALQQRYRVRLFINDYWELAIACGAYGVHLGQEDLLTANVGKIAAAGLRLGLSNHSWFEIACSHALRPSYLALGPVFATTTKSMSFAPLGLAQLQQWVKLLEERYALTAIGGIDLSNAASVLATGIRSVAVVRAITGALDLDAAVAAFYQTLNS